MLYIVLYFKQFLQIYWAFQLPLAIVMRFTSPNVANLINTLTGVVLNYLFLSFNQFILLNVIFIGNYLIIHRLKYHASKWVPWSILILNLLTLNIIYLKISNFSLFEYVYELPMSLIFAIMRVVHYAFFYYDNPDLAHEINPLFFLSYLFGHLGFTTGPFFDYLNFRKIFQAKKFQNLDYGTLVILFCLLNFLPF